MYISTGYRVLSIVCLDQLRGACHTHISYHNTVVCCCKLNNKNVFFVVFYSDKLANQQVAASCLYFCGTVVQREACMSAKVACLLRWSFGSKRNHNTTLVVLKYRLPKIRYFMTKLLRDPRQRKYIILNYFYSEDLNNELVQYSDHRLVSDPLMVHYSDHHLNTRQRLCFSGLKVA